MDFSFSELKQHCSLHKGDVYVTVVVHLMVANLVLLFICYHYTDRPTVDYTDRPTVLECTRFQGKQRTINIPQEIGSNYYCFGLHLLDDPNGTRVRNIELEYRQNVERINTEILREWATGRGKKPVTWETLTEVLRDIELNALASEIEDMKSL